MGRNNQQRQGNFGFQRKTPTTITTNVTQTQPTTSVAAIEESEVAAEEIEPDADSNFIRLPMREFINLSTMAGIAVEDNEFEAPIEQLNFQ